MSKRYLISGGMIVFFFLSIGVIFAHPPTHIKLAYDKDKKILHIEMTHVTNNIREHHIRRLLVFKNDQQAAALTLTKQASGEKVIEDVSLTAVGGDTILVRAMSKEGGIGEGVLVIPKPPAPKSKKIEYNSFEK